MGPVGDHGRDHSADHVRVSNRHHGRALSDLHGRQEAVARVCPARRPGAEDNRIEEAINISDKHRKSHLAMVVNSGLQEFPRARAIE